MNFKYGLFKMSQLIFILFLMLPTSGCLFLILGGGSKLDTPPKTTQKNMPNHKAHKKLCVYTMRGFLDVFSTGMNSLASKAHQQLHAQANTLSYLEEKRLSTFLIKNHAEQNCHLVLIGHSYGADEQITVAKRLNQSHIPVDLLITLDHTKKQAIPSNVRTYYNVNSGKSIISGIVPWGIAMASENNSTQMHSVNLVEDKGLKSVNHFNIDKLTQVQEYILEIIQQETDSPKSATSQALEHFLRSLC